MQWILSDNFHTRVRLIIKLHVHLTLFGGLFDSTSLLSLNHNILYYTAYAHAYLLLIKKIYPYKHCIIVLGRGACTTYIFYYEKKTPNNQVPVMH